MFPTRAAAATTGPTNKIGLDAARMPAVKIANLSQDETCPDPCFPRVARKAGTPQRSLVMLRSGRSLLRIHSGTGAEHFLNSVDYSPEGGR